MIIAVWHWRVACESELGNCESPKAGPECPGYRGTQVPNTAIPWVQGQLGERGGCTLHPFESCLTKAYAPPVVKQRRANGTLASAPPSSASLPSLPPRSIPREIWAHFCWIHQGFSWDGIMLSSGWDLAVLSKEGPFLSLCTYLLKSWPFLSSCTYLLIKTFQMSGDLLSCHCGCACPRVCVYLSVCACVWAKSHNKSALKVLVLSSDRSSQ